ncbi:hypothetical protein BN3661_01609 [Eubacteriaceae bacterium CHKCI005]|nr:hypothetical protein BN3661_01609 [Eubacteriaceae bacterium CHKCI005]
MSRAEMSRVRSYCVKGISYLLSFLACMLLALSLLGMIMTSFLLSSDFMTGQAEKSEYSQRRYEEIKSEFTTMSHGFGVPEDLFLTTLEEENIQEHIDDNFRSMVEGKEMTEDLSGFSESLRQKLDQYVQEQAYENTPDLQKDIDLLLTQSTEYLEQAVGNDVISPFYRLIVPYQRNLMAGFALVLLGAVVFYILLFVINRWKHRAVRYTMVSFIGAGLMLAVVPLAILLDGTYRRIGLLASSSMYYLYLALAQFVLIFLVAAGVVLIVIALAAGIPLIKKFTAKLVR